MIQNSTAAINVIVNAWGALVEMVHECDPDDMQPLYPNIWSKLIPVSSLALTASPHTAVHLLKVSITTLCGECEHILKCILHRSPPLYITNAFPVI